jgi:SAM-dependent methyltransferase
MPEDQPPGANAFRDFELSGWRTVVDQYHHSWHAVTGLAGESLLDVVGVTAGTNLLDVATGPGYVASLAAGRGARVVGLDFSAQMIAKAKELAPAVDFRIGDAEELPFADGTFTSVSMNFGLLHLRHPEQAISEAHRVLAPGGRFGFTVWASPDEPGGFSLLSEAVMEFGQPVSLPPGPDFYHYSEPGNCRTALLSAGFAAAEATLLDLGWRLTTVDDLFPAYLHGTVRTSALLRGQDESARSKIEQRVRDTALEFQDANGEIMLPMPAVVAYGQKAP